MKRIPVVLFASLALTPCAVAQNVDGAPGSPSGAKAEPSPCVGSGTDFTLHIDEPSKEWIVGFSPYIWITSFTGDAKVRGTEFDIDASFIDILEDSDRVFGLMGAIDANYDRLVFQIDGAWTTADISKSHVTPDITAVGSANVDMVLFEFFAGYRLLENPVSHDPASKRRVTFDAFVGGRVSYVDIDLSLTADVDVTLPNGEILMAGETAERGESDEWFEPFVGAQMGIDLTENWSIMVRGDVGGFGIDGSQFSWQAMALIGYHWRMDGWLLSAFGGYRALGQDYSNGDSAWNVVTHGPMIGARFLFSF
jgi:hypothetical protein